MLRLFVGIKIDSPAAIVKLQSGIKEASRSSNINWVHPGNFHITLQFMGEVEEFYINTLYVSLENVASKNRPITLVYDRLGYFGSRKQPRVIWLGFKESRELHQLILSIGNALSELGFIPEEKQLHPHVTLGRVKNTDDAEYLVTLLSSGRSDVKESIHVGEFQLIKSILSSRGPEYTVLRRFHLK